MPTIKVYPMHENALVLVHPVSGRLLPDGSTWEHDPFTARLLRDHEISTDPARHHRSQEPPADHSKPPAHATNSGVRQSPVAVSVNASVIAAEPAREPDAAPAAKSKS